MSFLSDWDDIFESLQAQRKKYGGSSIGASVVGASAGKGFRFPDEDAARDMVRRFQDRATSIAERRKLIEKAQSALSEMPFSQDEVSLEYLRKAIQSLTMLDELNSSALKYTQNYIRKIQAVVDAKHGDEAGIGRSLSNVGRAVT